ncbi:MAG TPA: N-acetylmuramoyl-L-alanine amidase [Actinomycetota bacterium]|nr:N-acetylmuramoyl-L-alanine amidase [Actinomycetota bacterium]
MKRTLLRIALTALLVAVLIPFVPGESRAVEIPKTLHRKIGIPESAVTSGMVIEFPFSATDVGLNWKGHGSPVVRLGTDQDGWGLWMAVAEAEDMSSEQTEEFAALLGGVDADRIQVRAGAGVDPSSLIVSPINTEDGPTRTVWLPREADAATPGPHVISRAEWGADESIRRGSPGFARIRKLIVHHTVTPNFDSDPAARIRAIYAQHVQSNGWDDIGYNFLIDHNGNTYEGRFARTYDPGEPPNGESKTGFGVIGAHAANYNTGSVGVAMLGTFTTTGPTAAAHATLAALLSWKADRHNISPHGSDLYTNTSAGISRHFPNIAGHRDVGSTACPGNILWDQLPIVRDRVEERIQQLTAQSAPSSPAAVQMLPPGGTRDVTPGATGVVSRTAGRVDVIFDAEGVLSDRTIGVATEGGTFTLRDHHFGGIALREATYNVRIVAVDAQGRVSAPTEAARNYAVSSGELPASGYWVLGNDGGVFTYGSAGFHGSTGGMALRAPVVGMAATPSGRGYWLVASDGGIFTFGDAGFFGSTGAMTLARPVVGMTPTRTGNGYWLVASDGGVFSFGDARFHGSMGGARLNWPMVGMARTPSGNGYWLVAEDGGIFTFGDAGFHGSTGAMVLAESINGMAPTKSGNGYWLVARDGGIFTFGDGVFHGSLPSRRIRTRAAGMGRTITAGGYFIVSTSGAIHVFGDAPYYGSPPAEGLIITAIGMAVAP